MKIKTITLFIFLIIEPFYAQNIIILDSKTKETIPYVTILNIKNKTGFYTSEIGYFSLEKIKGDSINVSHIGYKTLKLKTSELKDSIFLKQNTNLLKEVKIISGKSKEKTIGYIKKKKTLSWNIKEKTELATLIKYKKKYKSAYIKKIYLPIGKMQLDFIDNKVIESYPSFNSIFRVHIYSNSNESPGIELLGSPIILECNQNSPNIIEIDISNDFVKLPQKGIFIGIEMIGELDNERNLLDKKNRLILPSFQFTKKKRSNILSESFIKKIIDEGQWKTTKKHNKLIKDFSEFNMAISLDLNIYD